MSSLKRLRVPLVAAGLFLVVVGGIDLICGPGSRLYGFINERGFVQPTEIYVACVVAVLLLRRFLWYRRDQQQLKAASGEAGDLPAFLTEALATVRTTRETHGSAAAWAHAQRMADESCQRIQQSYAGINYLAGALPALGLFGTMLGLSNGLFVAFSGGAMGPESVKQFVSSLATAMDTTVLAMVLAAPLFACAWFLERLEKGWAERTHRHLLAQLGLEETHANPTTDALRVELRALAVAIAGEANDCFQQALQTSTDAYRENLQAALKQTFDVERARDRKMVQTVAAEVATGLARAVQAMAQEAEAQNRRLVNEMTLQMGQLEQALRNRTPEEIIIRYQHHGPANGNGNGNGRSRIGELINVTR